GSACPGSTRRACSAVCLTGKPEVFASRPSGSTTRVRGFTSQARTSWSRPGKRRPAGFLCATVAGITRTRSHPILGLPADYDADHMLVRTVLGLEGRVEVELVCEPAFDYGRVSAQWTAVNGDRRIADASGAGQTIRLRSNLALGIEGSSVRAHHF